MKKRGLSGFTCFAFLVLVPTLAVGQGTFAEDAAAPLGPSSRSEIGDWVRDQLPADWLRSTSFILENWQWLGLLALALLGIVVDRLVVVGLRGATGRMLKGRGGEVDPVVVHKGVRPFGFLAMGVLWWVASSILNLQGQAHAIIGFAVTLVMVFGMVWGLYRLVDIGSAFAEAEAAQTKSKSTISSCRSFARRSRSLSSLSASFLSLTTSRSTSPRCSPASASADWRSRWRRRTPCRTSSASSPSCSTSRSRSATGS